jgi:hypothetical protein
MMLGKRWHPLDLKVNSPIIFGDILDQLQHVLGLVDQMVKTRKQIRTIHLRNLSGVAHSGVASPDAASNPGR